MALTGRRRKKSRILIYKQWGAEGLEDEKWPTGQFWTMAVFFHKLNRCALEKKWCTTPKHWYEGRITLWPLSVTGDMYNRPNMTRINIFDAHTSEFLFLEDGKRDEFRFFELFLGSLASHLGLSIMLSAWWMYVIISFKWIGFTLGNSGETLRKLWLYH